METWELNTLDIEAHKPQVLRSDEDARIVAIFLPAGEELQEHEVHERAYVAVVAGEVEIEANGRTVSGGPGLIAHFDPSERHTVRATTDTRFLLVLAPWPGHGHPSRQD